MPARKSSSAAKVFQLKITLEGTKPPIWRQVLVPGSFSLFKLHHILQIAMGWFDSHLHQFIINEEPYSIPTPGDWEPVSDERRFRLDKLIQVEKSVFVYQYDFGDGWEHKIVVEKIIPGSEGPGYPICIAGKRACPPEDVGGIFGYREFLKAMADPKHEEHDSYLEWVGGEFDPEHLDLDAINKALQKVKRKT